MLDTFWLTSQFQVFRALRTICCNVKKALGIRQCAKGCIEVFNDRISISVLLLPVVLLARGTSDLNVNATLKESFVQFLSAKPAYIYTVLLRAADKTEVLCRAIVQPKIFLSMMSRRTGADCNTVNTNKQS